ncbi:Site-specific recombinase XerD [Actinoplanes philippinensis]|uniref:Site-specific recombinase XerD n=2 Tax=Actinoplanes philippinensis TaxID=35752 RepID=A0A1I2KJG5_9ACTN|nr:Site-specific recombinase XerD [Actinoplanes philippinensis]
MVKAFPVRLPSAQVYWTVLDEELRVVAEVDEFLRHIRFGRGCAESTTEAYARALALYTSWCRSLRLDWWQGAHRLTGFMLWLRHGGTRGASRVNAIVAVVRELCKHGVACGLAPADLLGVLYELSDDRWLPDEVRGENVTPRAVARARHRLPHPERQVDRATQDEVVALVGACRSARDRFIVLALARGLRRGELVSLRRQDVHFMLDASALGCDVAQEHLHVVRRDVSPRKAFAKSRRERTLPADALLVQAWDAYWWERAACRAAQPCDFVLVNLFREPVGVPMRPGAINELLVALSRRAGLERLLHPHMLRHGFASDVLDSGGALDEAQYLLGHARPDSLRPYLHPSLPRMRAAVDRTAAYRNSPS